jgi:4,5-dihydroxyphthalate decarboxylase
VDEHPWVPGSLVRAFREAQRLATGGLDRSNVVLSSPWSDTLIEEQAASFGTDLYRLGIEQTHHEVARMLRYLHEQHLLREAMPVEDLFVDDRVGGP